MKIKAVVMVAVLWSLLCFSLIGCSEKPDIIGYEDMKISVTGLAEDDFEITPKELLEMECASGSDTGSSDKSGTVDGYGPTLDTFLSEYGKKRSDFTKIRFTAKDGYRKTIFGEMLKEKEIILSLSDGDAPLSESETPIRLLIPGAESSYWVYGVVEIEFIE